MRVHTGTRRNGKTTKTFLDAAYLCQHKDVVLISPTLQMAKVIMKAFEHFLEDNKLEYKARYSEMAVSPMGSNSIYFIDWERTQDPEYFKSKNVYVLVDELGLILRQMFPSSNAKVMAVNLEHCGEELY